MRQAVSRQDTRHLKVVRFGDNMREVAVTDGDKVAAQIKFGFSVNTWAVGDLVQVVNEISDGDVSALVDEYESSYRLTLRHKFTVTNARTCWMQHVSNWA